MSKKEFTVSSHLDVCIFLKKMYRQLNFSVNNKHIRDRGLEMAVVKCEM